MTWVLVLPNACLKTRLASRSENLGFVLNEALMCIYSCRLLHRKAIKTMSSTHLETASWMNLTLMNTHLTISSPLMWMIQQKTTSLPTLALRKKSFTRHHRAPRAQSCYLHQRHVSFLWFTVPTWPYIKNRKGKCNFPRHYLASKRWVIKICTSVRLFFTIKKSLCYSLTRSTLTMQTKYINLTLLKKEW